MPKQIDPDLELLEAMAKVPGALRLVTPRIRAEVEIAHEMEGKPIILTDPSTFVWEDVVSIEPHGGKAHLLTARTAEGSTCDGTPAALLRKLQDWRGGSDV